MKRRIFLWALAGIFRRLLLGSPTSMATAPNSQPDAFERPRDPPLPPVFSAEPGPPDLLQPSFFSTACFYGPSSGLGD